MIFNFAVMVMQDVKYILQNLKNFLICVSSFANIKFKEYFLVYVSVSKTAGACSSVIEVCLSICLLNSWIVHSLLFLFHNQLEKTESIFYLFFLFLGKMNLRKTFFWFV